jgi:hypothetical protein
MTNATNTTTKTRKPRKDKGKPRKAKETAATVEAAKADTRRSIVPQRYKVAYAAKGGHNGDKVAKALKAATTTTNKDGRECLDLPALVAIAKENGVDFAPYAGLNNGQKRMCVGNKLRGILEAGERKVRIAGQTFGG